MTRAVPRPPRSGCPIATALERIGDRWTLVIVRDLAMGKSRYGQFAGAPEGVPSNILAARLAQMSADGLIGRTPYQLRPPRYDYWLTEKGRGLIPVMQAICRWAAQHEPGVWTPPDAFMALEP